MIKYLGGFGFGCLILGIITNESSLPDKLLITGVVSTIAYVGITVGNFIRKDLER